MEFSIRHRLDALLALYTALGRERLGTATRVCWILAIGSATAALLMWPTLNWAWTALSGGSVVAIALLGLARDNIQRQVRQQFELVGAGPIHYRIGESGLREDSAIGESLLRWQAFDSPRELAGFLLLPRRPAISGLVIALPLDQVAENARREIQDRIAHANATRMG